MKYGNDKQLMPTTFPYEIYQYAEFMSLKKNWRNIAL